MSLTETTKKLARQQTLDLPASSTEEINYVEAEVVDSSYDSEYWYESNKYQAPESTEVYKNYFNMLEGFKILYAVLTKAGGPPVAMLLAYGLVISQVSTILLPISLLAAISASAYLVASGFHFFIKEG